MDWELYERYRATFVLVGVVFLSFLLLAFQRSTPVQYFKSVIAICTLPSQRLLSRWAAPTLKTDSPAGIPLSSEPMSSAPSEQAETSRAMRVLTTENTRLRHLLDLKQDHWPRAVAAHVMGRDPQRWFQEILLDKGKDDGLSEDDPVVSMAGSREALVGRITEAGPHVSKVMLLHDSLSAVPASVRTASLKEAIPTICFFVI
jgi:cell shape-determining protein MreC